MIKPYTDELYFRFDDDTWIYWVVMVSLLLFYLFNVLGIFLFCFFFPVFLSVTHFRIFH